jgi:hypothetical protein
VKGLENQADVIAAKNGALIGIQLGQVRAADPD